MPAFRADARTGVGALALAAMLLFMAPSASAAGPATALAAPAEPGAVDDLYPAPKLPPARNFRSLGAVLVANSRSWAQVIGGADVDGALVVKVLPGSAAESGGIAPGDVVVAVDEALVTNADRAAALLGAASGSDHVVSVIGPDGSLRQVRTALGRARSAAGYLRRQLGESADPAARYLYARSSADPREALALADLLVRESPEFAPGHSLRAASLLASVRSGAPRESVPDLVTAAAAAIAEAIELDPGSSEMRSDAAQILLELRRPREAAATAGAAIERDAESVAGHRFLGLARLAMGQFAEALPELHRAVELDPFAAPVYAELARNYEALGRVDDARATREAMAALGPEKRPGGGGQDLGKVAFASVLVAGGFGLPMLRRGGARTAPRPAPEPKRFAAGLELPVLEALVVVGVWAVAVSWISRVVGVPEATERFGLYSLVVPGLVAVAAGVATLLVFLGDGPTRRARIGLLTVLASGIWITVANMPAVIGAVRGRDPWMLALVDVIAGPLIIVLAGWLRSRWSVVHAAPATPAGATSLEPEEA